MACHIRYLPNSIFANYLQNKYKLEVLVDHNNISVWGEAVQVVFVCMCMDVGRNLPPKK